MKKMKVLKNFKCNGVRKLRDQFISQEEKDKIGEKEGQKLINEDFIQIEGEEKSPARKEPVKKAPVKKAPVKK